MEFIIGIGIGLALGIVGMVSAMRRAASKPEGVTAKMVTILGGGGPKPEK